MFSVHRRAAATAALRARQAVKDPVAHRLSFPRGRESLFRGVGYWMTMWYEAGGRLDVAFSRVAFFLLHICARARSTLHSHSVLAKVADVSVHVVHSSTFTQELGKFVQGSILTNARLGDRPLHRAQPTDAVYWSVELI